MKKKSNILKTLSIRPTLSLRGVSETSDEAISYPLMRLLRSPADSLAMTVGSESRTGLDRFGRERVLT